MAEICKSGRVHEGCVQGVPYGTREAHGGTRFHGSGRLHEAAQKGWSGKVREEAVWLWEKCVGVQKWCLVDQGRYMGWHGSGSMHDYCAM